MMTTTTRARIRIDAPPAAVYRALLDPLAVAQWLVPDGMTSEVHEFDACEGGVFRISLTYIDRDAQGKTSAHTDSYGGTFAELVPDRRVVQNLAFETADPSLRGAMTITFELQRDGDGTVLTAVHAGLPPGVPPEANEAGWRMSLGKLARLIGSGRTQEEAQSMSTSSTVQIGNTAALLPGSDGPAIGSPSDVGDLLGEAFGAQANFVILPRARLAAAFFDLRTGLAGELNQKLANYRIRLVIVGDVAAEAAASKAFRDFVREANQGSTLRFVDTLEKARALVE